MLLCKSLARAGTRSLCRCRSVPVTRPRLYSTSPAHAAASTSSPIEDHINKLTSATSLSEIRTHYTDLVTKLKASGKLDTLPTRQILNEQQLYKILWLLARSGWTPDSQLLGDILLDMPLVLGMTPTEDTYTAIIRGLIQRGDPTVVRRWLDQMPDRTGFTPTLEHYHMLLKALPDMEAFTFKIMRGIVDSMRSVGCKPTHETFEIMWLIRWKLYDRDGNIVWPNTLYALFDEMEREGLPHSQSFSDILFQEYNKRGFTVYAERMQNVYDERFSPPGAPDSPVFGEMMDSRLMKTDHHKGLRSAIALLKSCKPSETPLQKQIRKLLLRSQQLSDLRLVEQELGVKCDLTHWSRIIVNNVRAGQLREALSIYDKSKSAGIIPDAQMVAPLIRALCHPTFSTPQDADIEKALLIYQDLCSAVPSEEDHADHPSGPDTDIYTSLLRGLATVKNYYKYTAAVKKILDDMTARDVGYDDSATVTSIIVILMRNATNTEEALEIYRRYKSPLDDKGYTVVLDVFCKLRFESTHTIPPLKGYFEIVRDMRTAGFNTNVRVYTILFHRLGTIATEIQQKDGFVGANQMLEDLIHTIRRAHDLVTLDSSLSPDAILWNQLINTYQRAGCFADAYRIWEMVYISGQFNGNSVSSILDACGYAKAYSVARRIVEKLAKDKYQFTSHNWNTWLECLCRVGKLDEAIKVLCGESENSPPGVELDVECVKLVLKFARGTGREGDVLSQVKEKSPTLWDTLPLQITQQ